MEDRVFKYALILSLIFHIIVFLRIFYSNIHLSNKSPSAVEIVYPQLTVLESVFMKKKTPLKGMKVDMDSSPMDSLRDPGDLVKDISKFTEDFSYKAQKPKQIDEQRMKRKVSIPVMEAPEIKNPLYLDYYQEVRSRIRERAYANFQEFESGEVYLTFVVDSSGSLRAIRIIEERTRANYYLKKISQQSVQEASPFSPFPSDLKYPELSFNVVISFKVE